MVVLIVKKEIPIDKTYQFNILTILFLCIFLYITIFNNTISSMKTIGGQVRSKTVLPVVPCQVDPHSLSKIVMFWFAHQFHIFSSVISLVSASSHSTSSVT